MIIASEFSTFCQHQCPSSLTSDVPKLNAALQSPAVKESSTGTPASCYLSSSQFARLVRSSLPTFAPFLTAVCVFSLFWPPNNFNYIAQLLIVRLYITVDSDAEHLLIKNYSTQFIIIIDGIFIVIQFETVFSVFPVIISPRISANLNQRY